MPSCRRNPPRLSGRAKGRLAAFGFGLALLAAVALAAGCADDTPAEPTPTPVNVSELLALSGDVMAALTAFHFELEHNDGGGTPLSDSLTVTSASGDIVSPDKISIDFDGTFGGGFAISSNLVSLGGDTYMTNPLTGDWESVSSEVSPMSFFDPMRGIADMLDEMRNPTLVSTADGAHTVEGALAVAALEPLLGNAAQGDETDVTLTIDARTRHLTRAVIAGRVTASEPDGVIRTITLSKFDEKATIEAPQ